ncbi:hypothetical protein ACFTXB_37695, partial [Streptomyces sp. NPDC057074]|uniref:hypothetical protein n=1 Tax=Streptomyces sp. NPDC057074 TaxID=3346015 RepID=UPI00362A2B14
RSRADPLFLSLLLHQRASAFFAKGFRTAGKRSVTLSTRPLSAAYRQSAKPFDLRMIDRVSELLGLLLTRS